jgi:hypothetical protein
MRQIRMVALLVVMALACGGAGLLADQHEKGQPKEGPQGAADMDEMMAVWMKYAMPGEHHKHLAPTVGTWEATSKFWMGPGAQPEEGKGTSVNEWALGNRFVRQKFEGNMAGQSFSGLGYTGYDNYKQKYVGVWMDSMSTLIMNSTGACDGTGKVIIMFSEFDDPVSGKVKKSKAVLRVVNNDHHTFEMYDSTPEGVEFKSLEIHYKRKR